jgi:cytochrome c nitrite reductase small subunit
MSRKKKVVVGVVLGVVVIGSVGAVGFWQYHEQPQFCATCHIMDPYLESWESSEYGAHAHGVEGVVCLDCHEPTLDQQVNELVVYMQGDYEIPLEELEYSKEECFDCHELESNEELIELTADLELNPHDSPHLGELDCQLCHSMHEESVDYCARCHEPLSTGPGWTTEVITPTGVAVWSPDMDCSACHVMDTYFDSLQDTNLLAYAHAQEGLECLDCHEEAAVKQVHEEAVAGKAIRSKTVDMQFCLDCHVANEHTSYEEVIGRTAEYMIDDQNINPHEPHADTAAVGQMECSTCHQMHEESRLINACYSCHHSGTFDTCLACHTSAAGGD